MTISVTHSTPADSSFSTTGATAWNADHTLTGVGTVAEQNANAVAITGGAIDGTVIGNTTPAAGTFTTLTATGQTSLGGAAGSESLRVAVGATNGSYSQVTGTASYVEFRTLGTNANNSMYLVSRGTGTISFYTNNSTSNEQFRVSPTASAVNYVQVTGAATGSGVAISSQGSDAAVGLFLSSKGAGNLNFQVAGALRQRINGADGTVDSGISASGGIAFKATPTGSQVNYFQAAGAVTGFGPVLSAQGSDTNIPAIVQPKGTGALQAQQTDSTATGGNARGANAVDWQTSRSAAAQVASGAQAVIAGGASNTASNQYASVAGGGSHNASGFAATIGGGFQNTASGTVATIAGGNVNTTAGFFNFVGGGFTNSGTSGSAVTTQSATMNGTTAVTLSGSNANIKVGQVITGTSIASFPHTYVAAISGTSLTLSQSASGSSTSTLSFFTPHGVVVGGGNNQATGSYSFIGGGGDAGTAANRNVASGDWSTVAGGIKNIGSGAYSFVGGGYNNTANNNAAFMGGGGFLAGSLLPNISQGQSSGVVSGISNNATGNASFIGAGYGNAMNGQYSASMGGSFGNARSISGNHVFAANVNPIAQASGISQSALLVLAVQTTDATATVLRSDGGAASTTNQVILPNNSAYYFKGSVVAGVTGGGNTKGWTVEGVIKRGANAASTTLVGTPTVLSSYGDAGATTWALTATADTTNGGLAITFTGQAGTTIRVVCKIESTEMTY